MPHLLPTVRDSRTLRLQRWLVRRTPAGRALVRADHALYRRVRSLAIRESGTVAAVRAFSALGEHGACWLALGAAGAAADPPRRERWLRGLGAVAVAYVVNVLLKGVVRRARPARMPALVRTPTALSFPSSHATASFAAARAYGDVVPAARPALYATATAMAASRVYLGVHYPSDVAVGAALGTVLGGALTR